MVLYYALGGGLGHFTRATTFLFTLQKLQVYPIDQHYLILHNVPSDVLKDTINLPPNTTTLQLSPKQCASIESVQNALKTTISFQVTEIYIDTFPLGLQYELAFLNDFDIPKHLVARIVKEQYFHQIPSLPIQFQKIYHVEPLPKYQMEYLHKWSKDISPLQLANFLPIYKQTEIPTLSNNTWLIVHSGPSDELIELYHYALENAEIQQCTPNFLIVSPTKIQLDIPQIAFYPAKKIYPQAGKIITACGYNSMLDTLPFSDKHLFLPFERRFDDQFLRASMRRSLKNQPQNT